MGKVRMDHSFEKIVQILLNECIVFLRKHGRKLRVLSTLHGYPFTCPLNRQVDWNAVPKIGRFHVAGYCAAYPVKWCSPNCRSHSKKRKRNSSPFF